MIPPPQNSQPLYISRLVVCGSITQSPPLDRNLRSLYSFEYRPSAWSLNDGFSMHLEFCAMLCETKFRQSIFNCNFMLSQIIQKIKNTFSRNTKIFGEWAKNGGVLGEEFFAREPIFLFRSRPPRQLAGRGNCFFHEFLIK